MRICLMVEGQEDVTWPQWLDLAHACEREGLEGLFRSDHYQSVQGRTERGALDAWATLSALGAVTDRIRLGTLVSPATFRHPSVLAKNVVTADHVSGGRIELGVGAGWHELEHTTYGFPFADLGTRYDVFEEQLEIIARQLTEERFDFDGAHHTLKGCEARPGPVQDRLPIIVGGAAGPRSVRSAARWADEYNTVFPSLEDVRTRRRAVVEACQRADRPPLTFSIMTGCILGEDEAEFHDRARRLMAWSSEDGDVDAWLEGLRNTWILGTVEQAEEQLADREAAGVDRIMLQHQLHDDVDMVTLMGHLVSAQR